MISAKLQKSLNKQIEAEAYAGNYYLAMASWCDKQGLQGSARFLYAHAEQEREHMMKLFHYVNDAGGSAVAPEIQKPPVEYKDLKNVFEAVLTHEKSVTKSINNLVDECLSEKDFSTFNFLQWYVAEQHEEEKLFQSILSLIKIAGTEGRGIFFIDKEIGKIGSPKN